MKEDRERVTFWGLVAALLATTAAAYVLVLGPEPGSGAVLAAAGPTEVRGGGPGPSSGVAIPAGAGTAGGSGPSASSPAAVLAPGGFAPDAVPAEAAVVALAVATVDGDVTIVRRGVASAAQPGDPVRPGDALATAAGARAVLAGGACALTLEEGGRIEVKESARARMRVRLETGLLVASVRGSGRAVEIESALDAVARTPGGTISVARSGKVVAAAVREGAGELRAGGAAVPLAQGEESAVADGGFPEAPRAIAGPLPLVVEWPKLGRRGRTKEPRLTVRGETAPGAIVFVGDERIEVQPDGRFVGEITLDEGPQQLAARALAVGERTAAVEGPAVILDTTVPAPKFDTKRLWTRQ